MAAQSVNRPAPGLAAAAAAAFSTFAGYCFFDVLRTDTRGSPSQLLKRNGQSRTTTAADVVCC